MRLFALFRVIPDWFVSSLLAHTSAHTGSIKDHTFFKPLRTLKHALGSSKRVVYGSPGHIFGSHDWFGKSITSMYVKGEKNEKVCMD